MFNILKPVKDLEQARKQYLNACEGDRVLLTYKLKEEITMFGVFEGGYWKEVEFVKEQDRRY